MMDKKKVEERILEALNWRAAVKVFDTGRKVDPETLQLILEAGRMAPTAYGLQGFKIIQVEDMSIRKKLLPISRNQPQVIEAPHFFVMTVLKHIDVDYIRRFTEHTAQVRNVTVESLKDMEAEAVADVAGMTNEYLYAWLARSAYIAVGMMIETAALLGVDIGPMEGFEPDKASEILGLEKLGLDIVGYLAVGYRSEIDTYSSYPRVRLDIDDILVKI